MWAITYKGKLVTLESLIKLNYRRYPALCGAFLARMEGQKKAFLIAKTGSLTKYLFVWGAGRNWQDRFPGIECQEISVSIEGDKQ